VSYSTGKNLSNRWTLVIEPKETKMLAAWTIGLTVSAVRDQPRTLWLQRRANIPVCPLLSSTSRPLKPLRSWASQSKFSLNYSREDVRSRQSRTARCWADNQSRQRVSDTKPKISANVDLDILIPIVVVSSASGLVADAYEG